MATGSTHTMPSYHALNFAWGEHCLYKYMWLYTCTYKVWKSLTNVHLVPVVVFNGIDKCLVLGIRQLYTAILLFQFWI